MLTQSTTQTANSPWPVDQPATANAEPLLADEIHVWRTDLDRASAEVKFPYLSDDEWSKAQRFQQELHRNRFIAGRALLRVTLSRYLCCKPAEIVFLYNEWGRPSIAGGLEFNLAHSENEFLLGISRQPIGVDIEKIRAIEEVHLVARTVFSPEELTAWSLLPEGEQLPAFYKIWTRKEALLKALGRGITEHCPCISVLFTEPIPKLPPGLSDIQWKVQDLEISTGLAGAVATPIHSPCVSVENCVY
jgi:4'-phosphopantetheinyl transferase